jgi:uncharacterized protein
MLARAGYHVLRFDYFATGDSAGSGHEGRPDIWIDNVIDASAELREISNARSLSIVGMRLGAALALGACARELEARSLVLWEPVVTGKEYLDELDESDRMRHLWLLHGEREGHDELLGHPVPAELRRALLSIDTCVGAKPKTEQVTIVAERTRGAHHRLRMALSERGVPTTIRIVKDDATQSNSEQRDRAMLSNAVLVEIVKQIGPGAN